MKKLAYLSIILSLLIGPLSAIEKKDCSGIKKISKEFLACKSDNLKASITNTGDKIKENTVDKLKKANDTNDESGSSDEKITTGNKISKMTKEKTTSFKNSINKMFSGNTKQYPKGTK
jgi:hypothetical protein|tara:strand:+ start:661 stop:1014 length:354 start_codon:yes stop_codon:yes gene_type:complete